MRLEKLLNTHIKKAGKKEYKELKTISNIIQKINSEGSDSTSYKEHN